jgi:organic hydroperoxide reductase OsmC/OhrA
MNVEASPRHAEQNVVREGLVLWATNPPAGRARIDAGSHAFHALPVSLPEGDPFPYEATPGELLAITHALFFAAALSEALALAGTPARELSVTAECTFTGPTASRRLSAVDVHVRGHVPGLDSTAFVEAAAAARDQALRSGGGREDLPGELRVELASSS